MILRNARVLKFDPARRLLDFRAQKAPLQQTAAPV